MPVKYIDEMGKLYESQIVGELDSLENDTKTFKDSGPEAADGFSPAELDPKKKKQKELEDSVYDKSEFSNKLEQNVEKGVKKEQNEINNSTMRQKSNKSTFDKLFEDVMGEEVPMDLDMGGMDDDMGDDLGDDLDGDTVTLELDRDMAEKLHGLLGDLLGGDDLEGDDDLEGADDIEDLDQEGVHPESHVTDAMETGPGDAVSKLAGHNNKVGGNQVHPAGGHGDGSTGGQEDGGKPKAVGHTHGDNKPTGDNGKVSGKVSGGNQDAFKA